MKKIINTIFAAALLVSSAISCQKEEDSPTTNNSPEVSKERAIFVSVTATMDELTPSEEVKSEVTPVIRLTWASEGDVVFVYDASKCLGRLDVTLKNNDARYAYLSGSIEAPSDGTEVLTCIHAKGLTEAPAVEDGKVTISLAEQIGRDSEIPFIVFETIDYDGQSSITDRLVNFSFATSVVNVNCIDLAMDGQNQEQIDKAYINGLNTACQLSLSGTAAPEVSGTNVGGITRTGITGGSNKLAFLLSVPVSLSTSERGLYVFQQSKTMYSSFTKDAFAAGKFINVMYKLEQSCRVENVSLNIESKNIYIGDDFTITAAVTPEDALVKDVKWSSSDENVATVDENGKVKGVAPGAATITATTIDGEKTANCKLIVRGAMYVIWENDGTTGEIDWNPIYRFGVKDNGEGNQLALFSQDIWDRLKNETFYLDLAGTIPQIQVTTGWWTQSITPEYLINTGNGTWTVAINIAGTELADEIDEKDLLFIGQKYTPLKLISWKPNELAMSS